MSSGKDKKKKKTILSLGRSFNLILYREKFHGKEHVKINGNDLAAVEDLST